MNPEVRMKALPFALLVALVIPVIPRQASPAPPPRQSAPSPSPKSDHDACIADKDHASCTRYYRAQCLDNDPAGCESYATELSKDCPAATATDPKAPGSPPAVAPCATKIKCWRDRALSLALIAGACGSDARSPNCEDARSQVTTAAMCDAQQ
jgi:hypothetical protein